MRASLFVCFSEGLRDCVLCMCFAGLCSRSVGLVSPLRNGVQSVCMNVWDIRMDSWLGAGNGADFALDLQGVATGRDVGFAFALVIGAGLCTTLGAAFAFCAQLASKKMLAISLGLSAGVMM